MWGDGGKGEADGTGGVLRMAPGQQLAGQRARETRNRHRPVLHDKVMDERPHPPAPPRGIASSGALT